MNNLATSVSQALLQNPYFNLSCLNHEAAYPKTNRIQYWGIPCELFNNHINANYTYSLHNESYPSWGITIKYNEIRY